MSYQSRSTYSLSAAQAKKEYFLTPADLATLPHIKPCGWVCGTRKYYSPQDCLEAAYQKHGEEGFASKRQRRANREANPQRKVAEAMAAQQRLVANNENAPNHQSNNTTATSVD